MKAFGALTLILDLYFSCKELILLYIKGRKYLKSFHNMLDFSRCAAILGIVCAELEGIKHYDEIVVIVFLIVWFEIIN